jgi:hypothetical protein
MIEQRSLRGDRSADGILGPGKGEEEPVALVVDLAAAVIPEGNANQATLIRKDLSVLLPKLPQQLGRPGDVCEEEGDGSGRQLTHGAAIVAPPPDPDKPLQPRYADMQ